MSENKFRLPPISLRQHTPIIHFQHDQEGATLRATEVKPKLDKYLIEKKGGWENVPKSWKVGGGFDKQRALSYKVRIDGKAISARDIEEGKQKHPCFFANIKEENPKRFTETYEPIKLAIFSFNEELLLFIEEHIKPFFLYHNFGTRQTKGFGNFLPEGISFPNSFYSFSVPTKDLQIVFGTIELFYKTLRSGLNGAKMPDGSTTFLKGKFYMKPMIWQYAAGEKVNWEKRGIKTKYFERALYKQQYRKDDKKRDEKYEKNEKIEEFEPTPLHWEHSTSKIVRDWLGLSTEQAWRGYPGPKGQAAITKKHVEKNGREVKQEKAIARMKSPLLFKPVEEEEGYRVHFCSIREKEAEKDFAKAFFNVQNNGQGNLIMDTWNGFNLDDFLRFSFEPGRIENSFHPRHIMKGSDGEKIYKEIIRIYNDIRKSRNA